MALRPTRREFITAIGAVVGAYSWPLRAAGMSAPLYPAMDLSYFDKAVSAAAANIKLGYAAITWGGNDRQAIEDIAALGFPGIQLRSNILKEFPDPADLRNLLQQHHLALVAVSSGALKVDASDDAAEIEKHAANAKYTHDLGGLYLQVTDSKPKRAVTADDYKKLGRLLTELGKRSADLGVSVGYHNHMGSMGQAPDEVDRILDASDPRYVKLELDIAHYFEGGGDSAKAIHKYRDRLLFLHIKDVEGTASESLDGKGFRFVELGRGRVDLPATFKALEEVKFRGWAVVELDGVTDPKRSPKESALISKSYLQSQLGLKI
jgi:inosose dehydratase